jgi:transposase-like protein
VEAVNLLLTSGRPLKRVAAELGISDTSLRIWRDRALKKGGEERRPQAEANPPFSTRPRRSGGYTGRWRI